MKEIDISDPSSLVALAANMKREATLDAKGNEPSRNIDSVMNNARLFHHEGTLFSLMLTIKVFENVRTWHLSLGSVSPTTVIPSDKLSHYLAFAILGEGVCEGERDPRRPNLRHFLREIE
jgi:hypothetical protein